VRTILKLKGHCPAKKNLWKRGRNGAMYFDDPKDQPGKAQSEIDWLTLQASRQWASMDRGKPANHPRLSLVFVCKDGSGDADNQASTLLDCLKRAGVIQDDNRKRLRSPLVVHWRIQPGEEERCYVRIQEAA
jgi:Holliday junction resolvase RusA-like endonuclease